MPGRKTYTPGEIADTRILVDDQVNAWRAVAKSADANALNADQFTRVAQVFITELDARFGHRAPERAMP